MRDFLPTRRVAWEEVVRLAAQLEPFAAERKVPPFEVERLIRLVLEFNDGLTGTQKVNIRRGDAKDEAGTVGELR